MDEKNNLFTKDKDFEGLVKKAKRASMIKTIIISFIVSIVVIFALYYIGTLIMYSKIENETTNDYEWYSLQGANIEEGGTIYNYSPLQATTVTERVKNVGGVPIPWGQREKVYNLLGTSKPISAIGPSSKGNLGDERNFFYFLGERVIEFYHPEVEYNNVFDDRDVLDNMVENTVVEMAFSFDRAYKVSEVVEIFDGHLEWCWVDTFDSQDVENNTKWNKEGEYLVDFTLLGDEAYGFQYFGEESAELFINMIERLLANGGKHQSGVENLVNKMTDNRSLDLQPENLKIIGVVVTGPAEELKSYNDIPMIKGATLGAVTKKYH